MVGLNKKCAGEGTGSKPCYIIPRETTFDICEPDYKGGVGKTFEYSAVKHVNPSGEDLVIKIMRTEVTLHGLGSKEAKALAQLIEIGRNEPINDDSKAYRKFKKEAEKEAAKAERRQEKAEERAERRQEREQERAERRRERLAERRAELEEARRRDEELKEQERLEREEKAALTRDIEAQVITSSDTETEAWDKLLKLNRLFPKSYDLHMCDLLIRTYEDNLTLIEVNYPGSSIYSKGTEQLEKLKAERKKRKRKDTLGCVGWIIVAILAVVGFYYFCEFIDHH